MKGILKCTSFHKRVDGSSSFHSVCLLSACLIAGLITSTFPSSDSESDNWSFPEEIFRFAFQQCCPSRQKIIWYLKAQEPPFPQENRETQNYSSFHLTTHANLGCINFYLPCQDFHIVICFLSQKHTVCANCQKAPQLADFVGPAANRKMWNITVKSVFESTKEEDKYWNVYSDIVVVCKTIVNYGSTSVTKVKAWSYFKETCGFLKHRTALK